MRRVFCCSLGPGHATNVLLFILATGLLLPSTVSAQLRVSPVVGVSASPSRLGTIRGGDWVPSGGVLIGRREAAFAYGVTLDYATDTPVDFRISGSRNSRSVIPAGEGYPLMGVVVESVWAGVNLKPWGRSSDFRPHLVVGGGFKRYLFRLHDDYQVSRSHFPGDFLPSGVVGIGVGRRLGPLVTTLEFVDHISESPLRSGDPQHDLMFTFGVALLEAW